ncbi:hypothetical protein ACQKKX_14255 [Neorhizobium sp. NPDC001467]|uniref:hypothetical protein n=1 Tax=Neorhizobium sp. NPDC001467 TaxID=3390595 RepID=UPI003D055624
MHSTLRHLATLAALLACAAPVLSAENKGRIRNATAAEIRAHINESTQETETDRSGFTYRKGSKRGYKISTGKICIRFENRQTDCADIKTDGTRFHMITSDGTRTRF